MHRIYHIAPGARAQRKTAHDPNLANLATLCVKPPVQAKARSADLIKAGAIGRDHRSMVAQEKKRAQDTAAEKIRAGMEAHAIRRTLSGQHLIGAPMSDAQAAESPPTVKQIGDRVIWSDGGVTATLDSQSAEVITRKKATLHTHECLSVRCC